MRDHKDGKLTPEQLDNKYNPEGYGEHPEFPRKDWVEEVANENTLVGYWQWLAWAIEQWEHEDD